MTIVTPDDLIAYMGGLQLNDTQRGIVDQVILPGVQQDLEVYLNRTVEPVLVRESLKPNDNGFLFFRNTPIHSIISIQRSDGYVITLDSTVPANLVNPDDYRTLDEWGEPDLFGYQLDSFSGGYAGYPMINRPAFYRVEYIAGYNGYLNEGLKLDIIRVAAREVEMQFDDTMSLRGGSQEAASDSDDRQKGWTEEELKKWDRLRRRVMV